MKINNSKKENLFFVEDRKNLLAETDKMSTILNAKYKKANLRDIIESTPHLLPEGKKSLHKLLRKY